MTTRPTSQHQLAAAASARTSRGLVERRYGLSFDDVVGEHDLEAIGALDSADGQMRLNAWTAGEHRRRARPE